METRVRLSEMETLTACGHLLCLQDLRFDLAATQKSRQSRAHRMKTEQLSRTGLTVLAAQKNRCS